MEDFVTYELAVKLKEKGFFKTENINCCYLDGNLVQVKQHINISPYEYAPTISQVLKWLREKKNIYVGISYMPKIINETGILNDFYYPSFQKIGLFEPMFFIGEDNTYDNYEEAALAGIEYCLDNLI